jgi:hypothetical protein
MVRGKLKNRAGGILARIEPINLVRNVMQTKHPSWEATLLFGALLFTVLMGATYGAAVLFRTPIPWLLNIVLAVVGALALRYLRRR